MLKVALVQLLNTYLSEFSLSDLRNSENIKLALENLPEKLNDEELVEWWKKQDISWLLSLQSYMFWMWTTKKIEYQLFENIYESLTPILAQSWSMPIEITTGLDSPLIEGGFLSREFNIFQYKFSPVNHGFTVICQEKPTPMDVIGDFDLVLDLLSFLLEKYDFGYLGFRQNIARKQTSSERATIAVGFGSEIRQDMIDFNFEQIESILLRVEGERQQESGLSLIELFRIRHRAVLDSSFESKLITLWSAIEAQWGEENDTDFLITDDEKKKITQSLNFLNEKLSKVVEQIGKLKNKTKNEKIVEKISELDCIKGWDVDKTIKRIHKLRSKFAHGGILKEKDVEEVKRNISFMMQIFNELISKKLSNINIVLGQSKP